MILTMVAMLSMTMAFAENENAASVNNVEAYDMSVNIRKLSEALALNADQIEAVKEIHHTFAAEMMFAAQYNKEERDARVNEAIYVLNEKQMRKYLVLLNTTINNRGLRK